MQIEEKFLSGQEINEAYSLRLQNTKQNTNLSRIQYLLEKVAKKRIIHLGFCDHMHLIDKQRQNGFWLHEKLCKVASRCVGIDINIEAVNYVKSLGFDDVYCVDVTIPISQVMKNVLNANEPYDYILIPDVIEHIDNPVEFMKALKNNYGSYYRNIIITVPNAFWVKNVENVIRNKEVINTDHKVLFSPYTLTKCLYMAGISVTNFYFADNEWERATDFRLHWKLPLRIIKYLIIRTATLLFPALRGVIICECNNET